MLEMLEMMRPLNGIMGMVGVLAGGVIALGSLSAVLTAPFLFALAAVFLITGAGNVFNDYVDIEADRINRPERPIPSGKVRRNSALVFSIVLFLTGNFFALMINGLCFTIALLNSVLLILYSVSLQHKILLGNLTIGYLVGSIFLFGGAVFLKVNLVLILAALAMLTTITREIVKDLEDMEGDRKSFLKKLTSGFSGIASSIAERFGLTTEGVRMKYREKTMVMLAVFCLMLAVVMSFLPFYYGILGAGYLLVVAVADIIFISCAYSLWKEGRKRKGYSRVSRRLKLGMFIALIAFIAGALI